MSENLRYTPVCVWCGSRERVGITGLCESCSERFKEERRRDNKKTFDFTKDDLRITSSGIKYDICSINFVVYDESKKKTKDLTIILTEKQMQSFENEV